MDQKQPQQSSDLPTPSILHGLKLSTGGFPKPVVTTLLVVALLGGIGTGYVLSRGASQPTSSKGNVPVVAPGAVVSGTKVGSTDTTTFKDCAKGQLETGGIQGEGTHHLIREGGPSQTAYLTSSVVDLNQFVGKSVEVCGQTIGSKHAGWLMDVGIVNTL